MQKFYKEKKLKAQKLCKIKWNSCFLSGFDIIQNGKLITMKKRKKNNHNAKISYAFKRFIHFKNIVKVTHQ